MYKLEYGITSRSNIYLVKIREKISKEPTTNVIKIVRGLLGDTPPLNARKATLTC